ncbi:MAG: F0F1 ATP synthase subunit A [Clostridiales bacterium]|nr:F0F1 ATP synthase subunit A [Clostridiales bacterium]
MVNTWVIMLALTIFSLIAHASLKKFRDIPRGFQNVVEAIVEAFDIFVRSTAGDKLYQIGNWYFMVFSFIVICNLLGVFGLRAPTADWSMTFACALGTFVMIQATGFRFRKSGYIKSFFEPNFLFFPLNVIGELSRPVSLSFRLFGNVLSGTIIITLIYTIAPALLQLFLPAALHIYFDMVMGTIQAYIFCVLSFSFIAAASAGDPGEQSQD